MPTPPTDPDLVERFSFSSTDDSEVTEFIRQTYADNTTRFAPIRSGARFAAQVHATPFISMDYIHTSIDYAGALPQGFDDFVFTQVHGGNVLFRSPDAELLAAAGQLSLHTRHVPMDFVVEGIEATTVRLPHDRLVRVAEDLTGTPDLRFHDLTPISAAMSRYMQALLGLVRGALADPETPMNSPLLAEGLSRTVATAALHVFPNTTMTRQHTPGPGKVTPATVRRAVAHIEANAHRPLQLGEIAAAAGTSARALQYGFRQHLGTTPLNYARRVRLEGAREELRNADPTRGETVAAVAARWGFGSPGRFAAVYRAVYGVTPHETLRG